MRSSMFLRVALRPLRDFLSELCGQKLFNRKGRKGCAKNVEKTKRQIASGKLKDNTPWTSRSRIAFPVLTPLFSVAVRPAGRAGRDG
jgi:hypothetical protein